MPRNDDSLKLMRLFPQLNGLVDPKVDREIFAAFLRVYEFFNDKIAKSAEEVKKVAAAENLDLAEKTSQLVNNFATKLVGDQNQSNNPLEELGTGTVTSISSSGNVLFNGSGPITESGTLGFALLSQAINRIFAGPTSGGSAPPTFRLLTAPDIPVNEFILRDTRANQPLATSVVIGTLYYVTDESVTERSNGATWQDYSDAGSGGGGAHASTHENGGADEINVAGLSGVLADPQEPIVASVIDIIGALSNGLIQGRLTTESGVAISSTDRTAQATIYFTPFRGNKIAIFNGTIWEVFNFTEFSLALSGLTSGKNYDVFAWNDSGTLKLELSAAWTNDNTRADALTLQDGILVKSGTTTRTYVATIRTTGTTTIEDSIGGTTTNVGGKRFLWNYYNRVPREIGVTETVDNWSYTTATWRQANAQSGNKVEAVIGISEDVVDLHVIGNVQVASNGSATVHASVAIGLDSTTTPSAGFRTEAFAADASGKNHSLLAEYKSLVTAGYHAFNWLEVGISTGTCAFLGDNGVVSGISNCKCGIYGIIWC